jgi:hypothetical protein
MSPATAIIIIVLIILGIISVAFMVAKYDKEKRDSPKHRL